MIRAYVPISPLAVGVCFTVSQLPYHCSEEVIGLRTVVQPVLQSSQRVPKDPGKFHDSAFAHWYVLPLVYCGWSGYSNVLLPHTVVVSAGPIYYTQGGWVIEGCHLL